MLYLYRDNSVSSHNNNSMVINNYYLLRFKYALKKQSNKIQIINSKQITIEISKNFTIKILVEGVKTIFN